MSKLTVYTSYDTEAEATIEFPDDRSWNDVEDWYVKYDVLHIRFLGDDNWLKIELKSKSTGVIGDDRKRPGWVLIRDESGMNIEEG